jgi:hypothetical protein
MATEKQVAANRANALKSTGPRSEAGKKASSANALTHGLTAEMHLVPGEDPQAFAELRNKVFEYYTPVGIFEVELADRLANLLWRVRRIPAFEGAVLGWLSQGQDQSIGQALEIALSKNVFDKISRYEASLTNQLAETQERLVDLVNLRRSIEVLAETSAPQPTVRQPAPPPTQITWSGRA